MVPLVISGPIFCIDDGLLLRNELVLFDFLWGGCTLHECFHISSYLHTVFLTVLTLVCSKYTHVETKILLQPLILQIFGQPPPNLGTSNMSFSYLLIMELF